MRHYKSGWDIAMQQLEDHRPARPHKLAEIAKEKAAAISQKNRDTILAVLKKGPCSVEHIKLVTGIPDSTIRANMRAMAKGGIVHRTISDKLGTSNWKLTDA